MTRNIINTLIIISLCTFFVVCGTNFASAEEAETSTAETTETEYAEFPYYTLEVPIGSKILVTDIADYISTIYTFGVSMIGILATTMIMFGGMKWLLAGGNQSKIGDAKEIIISAVVGLVLALTSYLLLNTINPKLVTLSSSAVEVIKVEAAPEADCDEVNANGPGDDACSGLAAVDASNTQIIGNAYLKLNPEAAADWNSLSAAYAAQFPGEKIPVVHMFRRPQYQYCLQFKADADNPASKCGSPHVKGYAVDVNSSSLTQEEYNFIVCGQTATCSSKGFHGFTVHSYNSNKAAGRISEQHHFNHRSKTAFCDICPESDECGECSASN